MPFDPSLPAPNSPLESQVVRDQLQALFNLINSHASVTAAQVDGVTTLPASSPANASVNVSGNTLHFAFAIPQGQQGPPFSQAVVDAVNSVDAGAPAAVGVSFDGTSVRFTFDIPRGQDGSNGRDGAQGPPGNDGSQGPKGNDGAQGPPFAQAVVDSVTTLDPGQQAAVGVSFDGSNVRFSFGIPRGSSGSDGAPGPPGEVSQAQLDAAISGTSDNSNSVSPLGQSADGSYNPSQMQDVLNKLDELINALRR